MQTIPEAMSTCQRLAAKLDNKGALVSVSGAAHEGSGARVLSIFIGDISTGGDADLVIKALDAAQGQNISVMEAMKDAGFLWQHHPKHPAEQ